MLARQPSTRVPWVTHGSDVHDKINWKTLIVSLKNHLVRELEAF